MYNLGPVFSIVYTITLLRSLEHILAVPINSSWKPCEERMMCTSQDVKQHKCVFVHGLPKVDTQSPNTGTSKDVSRLG